VNQREAGPGDRNHVQRTQSGSARPRFPLKTATLVILNRRTEEAGRSKAVKDLMLCKQNLSSPQCAQIIWGKTRNNKDLVLAEKYISFPEQPPIDNEEKYPGIIRGNSEIK